MPRVGSTTIMALADPRATSNKLKPRLLARIKPIQTKPYTVNAFMLRQQAIQL